MVNKIEIQNGGMFICKTIRKKKKKIGTNQRKVQLQTKTEKNGHRINQREKKVTLK